MDLPIHRMATRQERTQTQRQGGNTVKRYGAKVHEEAVLDEPIAVY